MNLDYVYAVDHFVMPGETLSADQQKVVCGGKGLNQSVALARAGAEIYHAGCVGQGGEMLLALLRESGVNTDYVRTVDEIQGNAMIQVNKEGQNCILLFGGSNQCIMKEQIRETLAGFSEGDYLVLQNEVNDVAEMVEQAYQKGMKVVLNPSPYNDKLSGVDYSKITWLLVNEIEAMQISGSSDPENAWEILHQKYPELSVVLTLGKDGSICYSKDQVIRQEAMKVEAVDTTAAGDTFTGYFLASVMEERELAACMERATIASGISVTREGAAPSIPSSDEVYRAILQDVMRYVLE